MSWISRVRQSLPWQNKRELPDNLWVKCKGCEEMIFQRDFEENAHVCPQCGHHARIGPEVRFGLIFDEARYKTLPVPQVKDDPLKFRDTKKYVDRLKAARSKTDERDAFINADGTIDGRRAIVGVQDFAFMGGSMGLAVGEAFLQGCEAAVAANAPYIVFTAAGGARMQEGILSLMQMPRATVGIERLHAAGLPYIVVLTDPTTGGVTASYAMLGDVQIAEPGALIGFAGQRVIEQTIRETLPDGFQRAEYLLEHGMIDMVVDRRELRDRLASLIDYLTAARAA